MKSASVIIPFYNQADVCEKSLEMYNEQVHCEEKFELIIVDDDSDTNQSERVRDTLNKIKIPNQYIKVQHSGRAAVRNIGVEHSNNDILIFSDADRVPSRDFVFSHVKSHSSFYGIIIGSAYDYYGNPKIVEQGVLDWGKIERASRIPVNYKRLYSLISDEEPNYSWLACLVGNASIPRQIWDELDGFDVDFKGWGYEHFEWGYRLCKNFIKFIYQENVRNYHHPHARNNEIISQELKDSSVMFSAKHPEINADALYKFSLGEISINELQSQVFFADKRGNNIN